MHRAEEFPPGPKVAPRPLSVQMLLPLVGHRSLLPQIRIRLVLPALPGNLLLIILPLAVLREFLHTKLPQTPPGLQPLYQIHFSSFDLSFCL